jgi:hypothetical protein
LRNWHSTRIVEEVRGALTDPYPQAPAPLLDGAGSSAALFSEYLAIVPSTKAVTP